MSVDPAASASPGTPPAEPTPRGPGWFSRRVVAVPFGHYEAGTEQQPPANEILIGREGQRAFFIDLLLNMGRRGAYLVTGRRGAGKTSFVRHCIAEYKAEVYGRYVRSNVGRALLWDRLIVLALFTAVILGALLLSQVLDILVRTVADTDSGPRKLLIWLLVVPMALLCIYPMLYAKELVEVIVGARWPEPRWRRFLGGIVALLFGVLAWFQGPFGSPAPGMSRLFVAIAGVAMLVQGFSYRRNSPRRAPQAPWKRAVVHSIALGLGALYVFGGGLLWSEPPPRKEYWVNLGLALLFLAAIAALRGRYQWRVIALQEQINEVKKAGTRWYGVTCVCAILLGGTLLHEAFHDWGTAAKVAAVPLALAAVALLRVGRLDPKKDAFRPRPLYALTAKALVSVVLALQLVHPALAHWLEHSRGLKPPATAQKAVGLRPGVPLHQVQSLWEPPQQPSAEQAFADGADERAALTVRQEIKWLVVVVLIALLLFYLEYEWIVRPFHRQRMDRALADKPASWDDQEPEEEDDDNREVHRRLASMTFPWMLYQAWLPVLVMSVNLGFKRLDHRRVVHAMLASLRDEYHRTFLAWSSGLANLGRATTLLALLALMTLVGEQFFDLRPGNAQAAVASSSTPLSSKEQALRTPKERPENVKYPLPSGATADATDRLDVESACEVLRGRQVARSAVDLVCVLPWGSRLFHLLYFDLAPQRLRKAYSSDHLLFWFLPYQSAGLATVGLGDLATPGLHLRVYHALLFLLLFVAAKWAVRHLPVLPYHETRKRLDSMLDSLSSRTSTTNTKVAWKPAQWLQGYFQDETHREVQKDPIDPRTLEFAFLTILDDIQHTPLLLPGARDQVISLPTPEITFVFDELDKLGARIGPSESPGGEKQEAEILDDASRRSIELHRLFADMKNLLSSAPARFIFVGGRNLHDEWLADQTARHPLLTNIFNAEVYLPSLLTDHQWERGTSLRLHDQVQAYLLRQAGRARLLYYRWARARWLPSFGLPIRSAAPESFATRALRADRSPFSTRLPDEPISLAQLPVLVCESDAPEDGEDRKMPPLDAEGGEALLRDFVHFMTYRSMGNPKRLKELLALFVRPVSRTVRDRKVRWAKEYDCRHVLAFGDVERFRLQLLADIYRHLTGAFERRLVVRDDKLAVSVFFLADYLFKFHRRAFSWSNLERVDELLDIHRAPDLREILQEILDHWSERFLHPIRNGMYGFRFRSDMAREIEYLSRQSPHEMAAFNFTLDESVALKSLYASRIQRLEPKAGQEIQDLLAGMGELHEFDQEYEAARQHYRRSIHMLDVEYAQVMGTVGEHQAPPTRAALAGEDVGPANMRLYITWGAARLRLMLQIGLTFEFARNLERAAVEYRNARTLARSLTLAMLGADDTTWDGLGFVDLRSRRDRRIHVLKNLNILFQPVFAEAWVAEKLGGGVDTSGSLVEKEIWKLRTLLPFVRDFELAPSKSAVEVRGSNFALIAAELHNKAGDLYFFKGRQLVSTNDLEEFSTKWGVGKHPRHGQEGYLLRAHYHYAMGLHELRRFVTHRRWSSAAKFNIWDPGNFGGKLWETISADGLPDYVFRAVGGTLNDLAETMLGRVSLYGLFHDIEKEILEPRRGAQPLPERAPKVVKDEMVASFSYWLAHADERAAKAEVEEGPPPPPPPPADPPANAAPDPQIRIPLATDRARTRCDMVAGSLDGWLGTWNENAGPDSKQILRFSESEGHDDRRRLMVSLHFTLVGAKYLERGGYLEDAASELFEVCETVTHYLWWGLTAKRLGEWYSRRKRDLGLKGLIRAPLLVGMDAFTDSALRHPYWKYLYNLAVYALRKADQLYRHSRRADVARDPEIAAYLVGEEIPPSILTLACSLGLAAGAMHDGQGGGSQSSLRQLILGWTRSKDRQIDFRVILERSLQRHSYPMINRLQGLKVLIDEQLLTGAPGAPLAPGAVDYLLTRTEELLSLEELFAAPMHFTPLQTGLTCGLVDLFVRSRIVKGWTTPWEELGVEDPPGSTTTGEPAVVTAKQRERLARIHLEAQRYLNQSQEMYTMRRAYYEAISNLYYLFDDFNDRPIHFNMAMQMAGTELVSLVSGLLHFPEAAAFRDPARTCAG